MWILISLVTTSLESAHISGVRSQIACAEDASMYSLFSYYEKALFDEYKILAINNRQDLTGILEREMGVYEQVGTGFDGYNHLRFATESVSIDSQISLVDNNGDHFQAEVDQIVVSDVIDKVKNQIVSMASKTKAGTALSNYMNKIMKPLKKLTKKINKIMKMVMELKKLEEDTEDYVYHSRKMISNYKKKIAEADSEEELKALTEEFEKDLNDNLTELNDLKNSYKKTLSKLKKALDDYLDEADKLDKTVGSPSKVLDNEEVDKETKKEIKESVEAMSDMTSSDGKTYKEMKSCSKEIDKKQKELDKVMEKTSEGMSAKSLEDGSFEKVVDDVEKMGDFSNLPDAVNPDQAEKTEKAEEEAEEARESFDFDAMADAAARIATEGLASVVLGPDVKLSQRKFDMSEFPSKEKGKGDSIKSDAGLFQRIVKTGADIVATNIYMTDYMDCFTDGDQYDLEYILGGQKSDLQNLNSTVNQLILLRSGLNFIYLMTDKAKQAEAQTLATSLFSVTGEAAVIIIPIAKWVILAGWAAAEAVVDVVHLLREEKVVFLKNQSTWNTTLKEIPKILTETIVKTDKKPSNQAGNKGFTYKEYLRFLLFFHSRVSNIYRGMDMIQWNLCQDDEEFRMKDCLFEVEAGFQLRSEPIFPALGSLAIPLGAQSYEQTKKRSYA